MQELPLAERSAWPAIPFLLLLLVLQVTLFSYLEAGGVTLQLIPAFVIAFALWRGSGEGLIVAFVGGMLIDLLSAGPLGSTTLALMLAVLPSGALRALLPDSRVLLPMVLAAMAMVIFSLGALLFSRLGGYPVRWEQVQTVLPAALLHLPLIFVLFAVMDGIGRFLARRSRITL
jgi:rod shape-determining protein MreD